MVRCAFQFASPIPKKRDYGSDLLRCHKYGERATDNVIWAAFAAQILLERGIYTTLMLRFFPARWLGIQYRCDIGNLAMKCV